MTTLTLKQRNRLDNWLEHDPDRFERYLRDHPEIEALYEGFNEIGDNVRSALREAVAAPITLATFLWDRSSEQSDSGAGAVALDLFGLSFATARILFGDE
jgi:hypothetical protein